MIKLIRVADEPEIQHRTTTAATNFCMLSLSEGSTKQRRGLRRWSLPQRLQLVALPQHLKLLWLSLAAVPVQKRQVCLQEAVTQPGTLQVCPQLHEISVHENPLDVLEDADLGSCRSWQSRGCRPCYNVSLADPFWQGGLVQQAYWQSRRLILEASELSKLPGCAWP